MLTTAGYRYGWFEEEKISSRQFVRDGPFLLSQYFHDSLYCLLLRTQT
jgi:hypothetical protein